MKPTKQQRSRRFSSFKFMHRKQTSWFYLFDGTASFHQPTKEGQQVGQQNVHGLRIKTLLKALKACGYIALLLCLPVVAEAKQVVTEYDDFLQIISIKEHAEKLKNKAMAENGVLVKLNGEKDTIITIQADQIRACEKIVQQQEQLGATQEQINQAVEMELRKAQKELVREKRLSRYKSEAFWMGAVGVVIMAVMN